MDFNALTFNRTSLESKPVIHPHSRTHPALLIEPVWNRNPSATNRYRLEGELLIEPVWNRNKRGVVYLRSMNRTFNRTSLESKRVREFRRRRSRLAFNRTSLESKPRVNCHVSGFVFCAFNRTSLESKHNIFNLAWVRRPCLLIEPVWNRNPLFSIGVDIAKRTFNRTSLESKQIDIKLNLTYLDDF